MNNSLLVVCEKNHPLFESLQNQFIVRSMDEAIGSYETYDVVIDLTILRTDKKIIFLKELAKTTKAIIISDLTCTFQEKVFQYLPQVKASLSSFFYSPTDTIEYYIKENLEEHLKTSIDQIIKDFILKINKKCFRANFIEITFTMPRVVSQIINEAYFALEEKLATASDIDSSMLYGVNYPEGPIAWGNKTGLHYIVSILEELYLTTHDMRYRPAVKLKKECL